MRYMRYMRYMRCECAESFLSCGLSYKSTLIMKRVLRADNHMNNSVWATNETVVEVGALICL